jgi:Protein of unknown function (DUF2550)
VHTVDVIGLCTVAVFVIVTCAVLARQRHMLRAAGAVPLAIQRGTRWLYGIGRYVDGELRVYRVLGIGTRPSRVLRRGHVEVISRRGPYDSERGPLPPTAVIIECRVDGEPFTFAVGQSTFTGFVSWLESSAPL